jgi:uncharacterized repeat protein (TIGR02543 family)
MIKRTGAAYPLFVSGFICFTILLFACSSPFHSPSSSSGTGLRLSFLIQGTSASTSAKGAKLLLPTVKTLTVALTPIDDWLPTPDAQTVAVTGSSSVVSASFSKVQLGHYAVSARAFDSSGTLVFRQTSTVNLSSTTSSVTLNMVPVDVNTTDLQLATAQSYTGTLDAGSAKTWAIPAGATISSSYGVRITADSSILFFVQDSTGVLLNTDASVRTITAAQASGSFLTLYNPGSSALPIRFVISGVNVVYDSNGATSGTAPADLQPYSQGDTVTVAGNTGNLARAGYSFAGWNTAANGSGSSYAPGASLTMGTSGIVLYAQWNSSSVTVDFSLSNPSYQAVNFSSADISVSSGEPVEMATSNGTLASAGTNWKWYVDGALQAGNASSFTFTSSVAGNHIVNMSVDYRGVRYSGSLRITVSAAAVTSYTVTYSNQYADSGTVPIDSSLYALNSSCLVLANSGSLARNGWTLVGWTDDSLGTGTVYTTGSSCTISGNLVLYPKWLATASFGFESLTTGNLNGQDGWVTTEHSGGDVQVYRSAVPPDTTQTLAFDQSGAGVGADASRNLTLGSPVDLDDSRYSYTLGFDMIKNYWGVTVGLGTDLNSDGKISRDDTGEQALTIGASGYGDPTPDRFTLSLPNGSTETADASFFTSGSAWVRIEMTCHGDAVTVRAMPYATGVWHAVFDNVSMGTNGVASDKTNPTLWNMLYIHFETEGGKVDNITFEKELAQ